MLPKRVPVSYFNVPFLRWFRRLALPQLQAIRFTMQQPLHLKILHHRNGNSIVFSDLADSTFNLILLQAFWNKIRKCRKSAWRSRTKSQGSYRRQGWDPNELSMDEMSHASNARILITKVWWTHSQQDIPIPFEQSWCDVKSLQI